ncbi:MAG: exosortase B [Methylotenera sp.]
MSTISRSGSLTSYVRNFYAHYSANAGLWLMFAGLAIMFLPTLWGLIAISGLWTDDEHAHGPIILSISLWLLWQRWHWAPDTSSFKPAPALAWICFVIAAVLYVPGRALDIIYFETGAFVWALAGIILMAGGVGLLNRVKFPLFFMIFMIPLPNSLVGPISSVMKLAVSIVTVNILGWAGLPVAQSGVIISLGQYQLLVADACAGMRTLFMLEALGILYLNLVHHQSMLRNIALPILIIPISFTANVIRVIVLALITYYWGSAAGQGFLHGFAGMVLFIAGLLLMFGTDSLLRLLSRKIHGN